VCPGKQRLPGVPPGPRIRFSAAWCLMSRATPASTAVPPCPQAISTGGARLNRNQARSATDCSRPCRRDGLINRRAAPQVQGRVSKASYSRNVTYDPRCVLDARTNSKWISHGRAAGRMRAATNQAAEEGYRVVRNGRISARNSAPGVGTSPQDSKEGQSELLVPTGLPHVGATGFEPATS
jgi:hypothetical protein